MVNCEKLTKAGIDIDSLLKRLMGNEALISVFVKKFVEDTAFEELKLAFGEKNMKQAEIKSHTLKGMCGNLSLDNLYNLFSEQTNSIRCGEYDKAEALMPDITALYNTAIENIKDFLGDN